jgi:hypothetical protein
MQFRWRPAGVTARVIRPMVRKVARPKVRSAVRLAASVLK